MLFVLEAGVREVQKSRCYLGGYMLLKLTVKPTEHMNAGVHKVQRMFAFVNKYPTLHLGKQI